MTLLRNAKQLESHSLRARDGVIGQVNDFYFDDRYWRIHYCVVKTGQWLQSRRVLISPEVIGTYDPILKEFPVNLTTEQVHKSPEADGDTLVSRQYEETLRTYYGWRGYQDGFFGAGGHAPPMMVPALEAGRIEPERSDSERPSMLRRNLCSANDTIDYRIEAIDGVIGHVEDFLIDDEDWLVRYLVVDTRNWWPGKRVIVAPAWIRDVSWEKSRVIVDLTRDAIKAGPPYQPTMPWGEDCATQLHEHQGPTAR